MRLFSGRKKPGPDMENEKSFPELTGAFYASGRTERDIGKECEPSSSS